MPLSPGAKVGPYEILGPLGAGGMGEVYRAHDSRLHRDVAIKTLPDIFAHDTERMARFQREAQVLAALNHPHIATIYGIEQNALVMEMVEGRNLSGPVPVDDAIAIARQITDALDAAHQKNIIHRDLKPANIKITPQGNVKVLDFGLAKALEAHQAAADPANSPTISMETRAGVILGTAAYMSPEQARGKPTDKRSDIWAFGVVFYELLTGHCAFHGETMSDTMAAVLRADLDWTLLPADTPVYVRRLLRRCLERDLNKRLRDIGDAWNEMDRIDPPPRTSKLGWLPWAIAGLAIAATLAWGLLRTQAEPPQIAIRASMTLDNFSYPALSHDGRYLAYTTFLGGATGQLMLRAMNELEAKPIPGAIGVEPVFSPDGQWIAYRTATGPFKLMKIPLGGGTPILICDLPSSQQQPSWAADEMLWVGSRVGLFRVPAAGGSLESITKVKEGEEGHWSPEVLPGGKAVLFTVRTGLSADDSHIELLDLKTRTHRAIVNAGHSARYERSGHVVFVRAKNLFAVPFDANKLAVTGPETIVVEGIEAPPLHQSPYAFSETGLLVFTQLDVTRQYPSSLEILDRHGTAQPLPESEQRWNDFQLSPDGHLVAGSIDNDSGQDVWIYSLDHRNMTRLTFQGINYVPQWTPDGKWVVYGSRLLGNRQIKRIPADRSGPAEVLFTAGPSYLNPFSFTPDGKTLFYGQLVDGKVQAWMLAMPGSGGDPKPHLFSQALIVDQPKVSPDGKWVGYNADSSGRMEVYIAPISGAGSSQISTHGGEDPAWSRNSREFFYFDTKTNELMSVEIAAGPDLRAGQPKSLFKIGRNAEFAPMPDGQHFVVERVPERAATATYIILTDWFADLQRKSPSK